MTTYYVPSRRRLAHRYAQLQAEKRPDVYIPVDVIARDDEYVLTAFVPGIPAEEISIEILDDAVAISGELLAEGDEEAHYLRRERPSGYFNRTLRLPTALDAGKAEAEVKHGVLTLRLPKSEAAKAKQVKVKVVK